MPHLNKTCCAACLILAMETSMIIPSGDAIGSESQFQESNAGESSTPLNHILRYISSGWEPLTRSLDSCKTFEDVKTEGEPILYLPADLPIPPALHELQDRCSVRLEHLPTKITKPGAHELAPNLPHGLLYLEHPYVVPGGQFNEMYGWDSYFIIRGLLREKRIELAKGMVDNFFF